jgi:hypothetical protein
MHYIVLTHPFIDSRLLCLRCGLQNIFPSFGKYPFTFNKEVDLASTTVGTISPPLIENTFATYALEARHEVANTNAPRS